MPPKDNTRMLIARLRKSKEEGLQGAGAVVREFCSEVARRTTVRVSAELLKNRRFGRKGGVRLKKTLTKLTIRSRREGGNLERANVPLPMQLQMAAYPLSGSLQSIATRFQVSRRTVPRVLACVADFQVESQLRLLVAFTQWLQARLPEFDFAAASSMYDETSQKLKVAMSMTGRGADLGAADGRARVVVIELCAVRALFSGPNAARPMPEPWKT